jgi:Na+-transporting NADH:ubiquinone oxidoreductase subunit A
MYRIRQGLDLPIAGEPRQAVDVAPPVSTVALVAPDYVGMKPTMEVAEGDRVKLGQLLFTDKKTPGVRYTSPAAGKVVGVNRGAKRAFQTLVVETDGNDPLTEDAVEFPAYGDSDLTALTREQVRDLLVESGSWPAFRTRPYSKVPLVDSVPRAIFVTAIDTHPLAADPGPLIEERGRDFTFGLQVIRHLTDGPLYLCKAPGRILPGEDLAFVTVAAFDGPHPAGLPGTHIHRLDPAGRNRTVWHIGYQDVIAIGRLFVTGRLDVTRVISLAGPSVTEPRLLRTRLGANVDQLVAGQIAEGEQRIVSGSVLGGRTAAPPFDYLGRFHRQITVLPEGRDRVFLGWQRPGFDLFSATRSFASALGRAGQRFRFTTSMQGSHRAMVPIASYEKVLPLDVEPVYLLRALLVADTEQARQLGALELDEEDLALCTFVCPGKNDYCSALRKTLTIIEKEG